ncbi:MAG: ATP-dependent sacrificial sulfur transferase LarE [Thermacetogeniaceae bacterium]
MAEHTANKIESLRKRIKNYEKAVIAFSGGVDSTFLLMVAVQELGDRVLAVTLDSVLVPRQEIEEAQRIARFLGANHKIVTMNPLEIPGVRENPPERCYYCKRYLFGALCDLASKKGYRAVLDGTNKDDQSDYRPGMKALMELGIFSPLLEEGIIKDEIRQFLRTAGLSNWNRPGAACLASRIPYGEEITTDKLKMIEEAEAYLNSIINGQLRVRWHQGIARIEAPVDAFPVILEHREEITDNIKKAGFSYVTLDLTGYRKGSLNEVLS